MRVLHACARVAGTQGDSQRYDEERAPQAFWVVDLRVIGGGSKLNSRQFGFRPEEFREIQFLLSPMAKYPTTGLTMASRRGFAWPQSDDDDPFCPCAFHELREMGMVGAHDEVSIVGRDADFQRLPVVSRVVSGRGLQDGCRAASRKP